MYGSLDFGTIDMSQVTKYMTDLWSMFHLPVEMIMGIAGLALVIRLVVGAFVRANRGSGD